jgi:predicted permease
VRLEPLERQADPIALVAVVCGVAPLPLAVFAIVPFFGLLTTPLSALSILGAIGCGIAGVVRAKKQPEPNYVLPLTGVVLGLVWLLLIAGVIFYFSRRH